MHERNTGGNDAEQNESHPYRMRLPGFITEEEVGLGDVVKRVSHTFGIKPCGGCERRAAMFNRWLLFTGHAK